jgi:hypothetical protein
MVSQQELHDLFSYDPETGDFFWRHSAKGRRLGRPAGTVDRGYRMIHIAGEYYQAQRLAWIYVYGEVPEGQRVRFDNGDSLDCRITNLRLKRSKKEHNALFRLNNPDANRKAMYKKLYSGMTIEEFEAMSLAQRGACAACLRPETQKKSGKLRWLAVDHDHATGDVRGLLCSRCNTSLGYAQDDPVTLRALADYLEAHAAKKAAA